MKKERKKDRKKKEKGKHNGFPFLFLFLFLSCGLNLKTGQVSVIDTGNWQEVTRIATPGPGFFLRSHERTPYAWVDSMMSAQRDTPTLIDKRTLQVAHTLRPRRQNHRPCGIHPRWPLYWSA